MSNGKTNRDTTKPLGNTKPINDISKAIVDSGGINNLAKSMSEAFQPKIHITVPQAMIDSMNALSYQISTSTSNIVKPLVESYNRQFKDLFKNLHKVLQAYYPSNWIGPEGESIKLPSNLETLLLDEGLPLAWVLPYPVLKKVVDSHSHKDRRSILYRNRKHILTECSEILSTIDNDTLESYVRFAIESIDAIHSNHWKASQALSANLLESVLSQVFTKDDRLEITSQKKKVDWKKFPVKEALVVGGIWGSYSKYKLEDGDTIPYRFTRHASAHAVSDKQYSNINALIAIMHTTALLKLISEIDVPKTKK